jgi:hypothetical protein
VVVRARRSMATGLAAVRRVAYLDGIDGAHAPALRQGGTAEMLDGLARYLTAQPASRPGTDDFRAAVASEAPATGHTRRGHASAAARDRHVPLASTVPRRPETEAKEFCSCGS